MFRTGTQPRIQIITLQASRCEENVRGKNVHFPTEMKEAIGSFDLQVTKYDPSFQDLLTVTCRKLKVRVNTLTRDSNGHDRFRNWMAQP